MSWEHLFPAFGMNASLDLLALLIAQSGEGVLNEFTLIQLFDAGEVDFRRNLQFTGLTTFETPGCIDCGHFDFLCFFHYCCPS
jgi:hypothetical protein